MSKSFFSRKPSRYDLGLVESSLPPPAAVKRNRDTDFDTIPQIFRVSQGLDGERRQSLPQNPQMPVFVKQDDILQPPLIRPAGSMTRKRGRIFDTGRTHVRFRRSMKKPSAADAESFPAAAQAFPAASADDFFTGILQQRGTQPAERRKQQQFGSFGKRGETAPPFRDQELSSSSFC